MTLLSILLQAGTPGPKDIPLPLPVLEWLLVLLLVISFLAHILFVNLMLGGAMLTLWSEIKGLRNPEYDELARQLAKTITVNKSLAVVLGVAPLLTINTLYTLYFSTANVLTGLMWIAIIPLVTVAFLLTYLHKYTWNTLAQQAHAHRHHRDRDSHFPFHSLDIPDECEPDALPGEVGRCEGLSEPTAPA